ncbi:hypothetical protein BGZ63DRAFT_346105 [Mariannaea sp. PMI_226]|nr:hypothetical protein BGZ63DRAFT_346105 [Mariannaea sp. PMI_226]
MAPTPEDEQPLPSASAQPQLGPGDKTLHVWSKPVQEGDSPSAQNPNERPTISGAVSMIKKEDFANIASTPCARQGFLTGIASGAGLGGLHFVVRGNAIRAANWAVGFFVIGSMGSYEWCQYLRRCERRQMKRQIEIVAENRREEAKKRMEKKKEELRLEAERKAAEKPWYKVW